jgi:hypothetical protein
MANAGFKQLYGMDMDIKQFGAADKATFIQVNIDRDNPELGEHKLIMGKKTV